MSWLAIPVVLPNPPGYNELWRESESLTERAIEVEGQLLAGKLTEAEARGHLEYLREQLAANLEAAKRILDRWHEPPPEKLLKYAVRETACSHLSS